MDFPPPIIVIDTREQLPLPIQGPHIRGTLPTGDYSVAGLEDVFSIERKSIADLTGCCCGDNRERFERELGRLKGFDFRRLLIVGRWSDLEAGNYRSRVSAQSVMGSLSAWEIRHSIPIVCELTPERAAARVERWARYFVRELFKRTAELTRAAPQTEVTT